MLTFKTFFYALVFSTLLCFGCSEEETSLANKQANMASLSFGALLNDKLANKTKLKEVMGNIPECSDSDPAYVEVILTGPQNVGSEENPLRIAVIVRDTDGDGNMEYFTKYADELELIPGDYNLTHFVVFDADNNIIWATPQMGNVLAMFVNRHLPFQFQLDAGVKKYLGVEVLCYDDRMVNVCTDEDKDCVPNEDDICPGFDDRIDSDGDGIPDGCDKIVFEVNETFEFCLFANYCDENGRHFPASISVDVWLGTNGSGTQIYNDKVNTVENEGQASASPVCFALPNLPEFADGEDYLYYEVTLQDWTAVYGNVENNVLSGTLSRNDITENFVGENNLEYEHLFFGCDDAPGEVE